MLLHTRTRLRSRILLVAFTVASLGYLASAIAQNAAPSAAPGAAPAAAPSSPATSPGAAPSPTSSPGQQSLPLQPAQQQIQSQPGQQLPASTPTHSTSPIPQQNATPYGNPAQQPSVPTQSTSPGQTQTTGQPRTPGTGDPLGPSQSPLNQNPSSNQPGLRSSTNPLGSNNNQQNTPAQTQPGRRQASDTRSERLQERSDAAQQRIEERRQFNEQNRPDGTQPFGSAARGVGRAVGDTARGVGAAAGAVARDALERTADTVRGAGARVNDAVGNADARQVEINRINGQTAANNNIDRGSGRSVFGQNLGATFDTQNNALRVGNLTANSSAARLGLRRGDQVVSINGQNINSEQAFHDQMVMAAQNSSDGRIPLVVSRDGVQRTMYWNTANLAAAGYGPWNQQSGYAYASGTPFYSPYYWGTYHGEGYGPYNGQYAYGATATGANNGVNNAATNNGNQLANNDTTATQQTNFRGSGAHLGVVMDSSFPNSAVVRTVSPGSAAEQAQLRPGDVIQRINGQPVRSIQSVINTVSAMQPNQQLEIEYIRPETRKISVTLGTRENSQQNGASTSQPKTEENSRQDSQRPADRSDSQRDSDTTPTPSTDSDRDQDSNR